MRDSPAKVVLQGGGDGLERDRERESERERVCVKEQKSKIWR